VAEGDAGVANQLRGRFWIESVLATTAGILAVVTTIWGEWIEVVLRVDPDAGSGSLEWMMVAALACTALAAGIMARSEFRRTLPLVAST